MQRSFHKNRSSAKYRTLKSKFKRMKRKAVKEFYSSFVTELKKTDPSKWYGMAKKIGAVDQMTNGDVQVESISGLTILSFPPTYQHCHPHR